MVLFIVKKLNRQTEIGRGGERFSFESKEKQKTFF